MKLARFRVNDWESSGLVEGEQVRVIQGSIFGEYTASQASYPLERVKLLPRMHQGDQRDVQAVAGDLPSMSSAYR